MDSGNSGSLHSSSTGGDDDHDSRTAASFFDVDGVISNPPSQLDPFSSFMPSLHQNPNPFLTNPNTPFPVPASLISDPKPISDDVINTLIPSFQPPAGIAVQNTARKSRKRSRASRRAPTTVLTTDTTNFRAMVQEFTGIPSPPFDHLSLQRSRLDLYGQRFSALEPYPPPYLRRPFPRKAQSTPPLVHSSPTNSKISSIPSTIGIPNSISPINFQFLPNPIPETNPKFPSLNSSTITQSKPNSFDNAKIDSLAELINPQNHVNSSPSGLQTLISSVAENNDEDEFQGFFFIK